MNDEHKTPADGDKTPADTTPVDEHATVEQPATAPADPPATPAEPAPAASANRTRKTLIAGGAGLALAGGLVGFGIGHASAEGGDGDRFRQSAQYAPGEGRGFSDGDRPSRPSDGDSGKHFRNRDSDDQPSSES